MCINVLIQLLLLLFSISLQTNSFFFCVTVAVLTTANILIFFKNIFKDLASSGISSCGKMYVDKIIAFFLIILYFTSVCITPLHNTKDNAIFDVNKAAFFSSYTMWPPLWKLSEIPVAISSSKLYWILLLFTVHWLLHSPWFNRSCFDNIFVVPTPPGSTEWLVPLYDLLSAQMTARIDILIDLFTLVYQWSDKIIKAIQVSCKKR